MKKFFAVFFVLVLLAGAGLFFGWAQRAVPPDAYGVLRSKSHGVYPQLIVPGEFRWVWYSLIPTNTRTDVFRLSPVRRQLNASGTLPSAGVYAAFLGIDEDFSWEINAAVDFSLRPQSLIDIAVSKNIRNQEELDKYLSDIADGIQAFIRSWVWQDGGFSARAESLLRQGEIPQLAAEIERRFPDITGFSLRVNSAGMPDFALYEQARTLHGDFVSLQRDFLNAGDLARGRLETFSRIEELEMYGELLTRFPVLLEFLSIEAGRPGN